MPQGPGSVSTPGVPDGSFQRYHSVPLSQHHNQPAGPSNTLQKHASQPVGGIFQLSHQDPAHNCRPQFGGQSHTGLQTFHEGQHLSSHHGGEQHVLESQTPGLSRIVHEAIQRPPLAPNSRHLSNLGAQSGPSGVPFAPYASPQAPSAGLQTRPATVTHMQDGRAHDMPCWTPTGQPAADPKAMPASQYQGGAMRASWHSIPNENVAERQQVLQSRVNLHQLSSEQQSGGEHSVSSQISIQQAWPGSQRYPLANLPTASFLLAIDILLLLIQLM